MIEEIRNLIPLPYELQNIILYTYKGLTHPIVKNHKKDIRNGIIILRECFENSVRTELKIFGFKCGRCNKYKIHEEKDKDKPKNFKGQIDYIEHDRIPYFYELEGKRRYYITKQNEYIKNKKDFFIIPLTKKNKICLCKKIT